MSTEPVSVIAVAAVNCIKTPLNRPSGTLIMVLFHWIHFTFLLPFLARNHGPDKCHCYLHHGHHVEDGLDTAQRLLVSYIANSFGFLIQDATPYLSFLPQNHHHHHRLPRHQPLLCQRNLPLPLPFSILTSTTHPSPQPEVQMSTLFLMFKVPLHHLPYTILFVSLFPILAQWNSAA